jgi:hypothetical protein
MPDTIEAAAEAYVQALIEAQPDADPVVARHELPQAR